MKHETKTNLINHIALPISTILLFMIWPLLVFGQTANRAPVVSNVGAEQRAGTRLVDITYNVEDPDGDAMTVSVQISDDRGLTFNVAAETFSGDVGAGITSGTGKRIVWDAATDLPDTFGTNYVAKVIADDGIMDTSPEEIISEIDGATMRLIPAGEFEMGDNEGFDEDRPVHTVFVDAFYMDVTEVTNAMYTVFLNVMGRHFGDTGNVWLDIGGESERIELVGGQYRSKAGFENHPVVEVSWYGAMAYAIWAGKRPPTEAEWEKAARGGLVEKKYPWGDNEPDETLANFNFGVGGTTSVGKYPPNGYGLYDMAGNVWEWCLDEWDSEFYQKEESQKANPFSGIDINHAINNFTNKTEPRVLRGGAWVSDAKNVRFAVRWMSNPGNPRKIVGFRCAVRVEGETGSALTNVFTLSQKETEQTPTFQLSATNTKVTVMADDQTVRYRIRLDGENNFSGVITLFATELPLNTTAKFDPKQITLSEDTPIDIADLTLTFTADIPAEQHDFIILAVSESGTPKQLKLTLVVETIELAPTRLTLTVQPDEVGFMESVNITGDLVPLTAISVELDNQPITLIFTAPSGTQQTFEAQTDMQGTYKLTQPFVPDEVGEWKVEAQFAGNNELTGTEWSKMFTVTKRIASITFQSGETGILGTQFEIIGQLTPPLEGEPVTLRIRAPNNAISTLTNITTEEEGIFTYALLLDQPCEWSVTATWTGNAQYQSTTETSDITVTQENSKAIIVLGGGDRNDNPAWSSFNRVAEYVHNILIKREFDDEEDIWFLSPDPTRTSGADTQTTESNLQLAITNWAKPRVNPQVPLFIYLLSHNLEDRFLLEKGRNSEVFLSPDMFAGWLEELPEGTPVTIIIEACHSGNFITAPLISPDRTVIVSARGDRQAKITPMSSFSKTFFDQINLNKTIAEAFRFTQAKMLVLRSHRSQLPQMDANGNGRINEPQDFAILAKRYIPENIVSLADPPEFVKITEDVTLTEGISSQRIEAELLGVGISRVVATVIPPDFDPDATFDDWNALAFDEFDLADAGAGETPGTTKYAAAYANFTLQGEYTVILNASNTDGSAEAVETTITVPGGETSWDVDGNGVVNIFDLVLVAGNFGKSGVGIQGDANGDGVVNIFDLVLVAGHFGESIVATHR